VTPLYDLLLFLFYFRKYILEFLGVTLAAREIFL